MRWSRIHYTVIIIIVSRGLCRRRLSRGREIWLFTRKRKKKKDVRRRVSIRTKWNNTHTYAISVRRQCACSKRRTRTYYFRFTRRHLVFFSTLFYSLVGTVYARAFTHIPNFMVSRTHCPGTRTPVHKTTPPSYMGVVSGSPFLAVPLPVYLLVGSRRHRYTADSRLCVRRFALDV